MTFAISLKPARGAVRRAAQLLPTVALTLTLAWQAPPVDAAETGINSLLKGNTPAERRGVVAPAPAVASTTTAPPYAVAGFWDQLQQTVLAQGPAGPITALDLLMLDAMQGGALRQLPLDALLHPNMTANEGGRSAIRTALQQYAAWQMLAAKAGDWQPPADEVRVKAFGAAIASYNKLFVEPQVKVEPADVDHYYLSHAEKYLNRRRVEVRYIFIPVAPNDLEATRAATERLNQLARDIKDGKQQFSEAAKQISKAPSAGKGGLIAPFYNGSYFQAFEDQAFSLRTPGELSSIFQGPGGLYMQELVQIWPAANIPIESVRSEITNFLHADHIKFYYQHALDNLKKKLYATNNSAYWEYLDLNAPVAQVGARPLDRESYFRYYPSPNTPAYAVEFAIVVNSALSWIEGEAATQALEKAHQIDHPYVARGRELATMLLRAGRVLRDSVPLDQATPEATAITTLEKNKAFMKGVRTVRLVGFQLSPKLKPAATLADQARASHQVEAINQQFSEGMLPSSGQPQKLKDWWQKHGRADAEPSAEAMKELRDMAEKSQWQGVDISFIDLGWVPAIPGTPWAVLLTNTKVGELSPTQAAGLRSSRYLVLAERPTDLTEWKSKPLFLQNLAFRSVFQKQLTKSVAEAKSQVKYNF